MKGYFKYMVFVLSEPRNLGVDVYSNLGHWHLSIAMADYEQVDFLQSRYKEDQVGAEPLH